MAFSRLPFGKPEDTTGDFLFCSVIPRLEESGAWEGHSAISRARSRGGFISGLDPQGDRTASASAGPSPARPLEGLQTKRPSWRMTFDLTSMACWE